MNSCTIFYSSQHHLNTEKLVLGIAQALPEVTIVPLKSGSTPSIPNCELIGFASGIYMGKPHPMILDFIKLHKTDLKDKKIFTLLTSGSKAKKYDEIFHGFLKEQDCNVIGNYQCAGFNTYGLFKLFGGRAKGHPNNQDISKAVSFVGELMKCGK